MAGHRDPVLLQHLSDLACGPTRPVEDLPVGEPDSGTAIGGGVEIPFEIRIAPGRRIMVHAAVELDDEPFAVLGIAVADADGGLGPLLSRGLGQTMRTLDANEIAVLKDRAGAIGDIDQHPA